MTNVTKFEIYDDEDYPVYYLRDYRGIRPVIDLTDEELVDLHRVRLEYAKWQERLSRIYRPIHYGRDQTND
jgi:hypothetical protein